MKPAVDRPMTDSQSASPTTTPSIRQPLRWQTQMLQMGFLLCAIVSPLAIATASVAAIVPYPSDGDEVLEVQRQLNDLGYSVNEDGAYGGETQQAIIDFQQACGLHVDGVVGEDTAKGLNGGCRERATAFSNGAGSRSRSYLSGKYVVMIPTGNAETLRRVQGYVPEAKIDQGRSGAFIRVATYDRSARTQAEQQYRYLQEQGFRDAHMRLF